MRRDVRAKVDPSRLGQYDLEARIQLTAANKRLKLRFMPVTNRCDTPTNWRVLLILPVHAASSRTPHAEDGGHLVVRTCGRQWCTGTESDGDRRTLWVCSRELFHEPTTPCYLVETGPLQCRQRRLGSLITDSSLKLPKLHESVNWQCLQVNPEFASWPSPHSWLVDGHFCHV